MDRGHKNRKSGWSMPIIITLLVVIGVGLFGIRRWEQQQQAKEAEQYLLAEEERVVPTPVSFEGQTYKLRDDLDTYLLIGLDKFSDMPGESGLSTNHQQADFLFLVVVDHSDKSYSAIHLNRDAMSEIQRLGMSGRKIGTFTGQLALAHTFGSGGRDSCRNTAQAVSQYLLGVPVDHYFSLTMDAIPLINDLAGGVVVHIDDDFSAIDPTLEQGKDVRLWGQHALTFVRTRHYVDDSSNLSRMNRQKAYLYGLHDQLVGKLSEDSKFGARLISKLADFNVSDLTSDEMINLSEKIKDYRFTGIRSIPGEASLGEKYMEFYTDEAALQELVFEVFYKSVS